jgi:hypothetical protein
MGTEVWAVSMVRDEADIVGATVEQMLTQVDRVLIADNGSVDGTREILEGLNGVEVIDDPDPAYRQSEKMSALAQRAAAAGAEWVVAFDADEWWYSPHGRIADILAEHPGAVATAAIYDHVATAADPDEPNPVDRIGWRRPDPLPLHKIACRPSLRATITQGNHSAHYPSLAPLHDAVVIRHFPYRSVEQVVRKIRNGAAAYAAADLPEDMGAHWRQWGRILDEQGEEAIADLFRKWHWREDPRAWASIEGEGQAPLIFDPAPR